MTPLTRPYPPWAPRGTSASGEPDVLSKHRAGISQKCLHLCLSEINLPLIPLLTDKSHPVYFGGQGWTACRSACSAWENNEDRLYGEEKKPCICLQKPLCKRFPPPPLPPQSRSDGPTLLQPQHSKRDAPPATERGKGVKLRDAETCPVPQPETPPRCSSLLPGSTTGGLGELYLQPHALASIVLERSERSETSIYEQPSGRAMAAFAEPQQGAGAAGPRGTAAEHSKTEYAENMTCNPS